MKSKKLTANLFLLLAAAIWGLAFVAQRVGMDYVGPFTFNGIRFILGSLSLVPFLFRCNNSSQPEAAASDPQESALRPGILAGIILFIAASLQQIGLVYTTAGKAAFLTALYIIIVPLAGVCLRQYIGITTWIGALLAIWGVYLLSVTDQFFIAYGDLLVLAGSLFWAVHILLIDNYARRVDVLKLAFVQFITCAIFSLAVAAALETITLAGLRDVIVPILYAGIGSVGIAYTLQIVGQKNAMPSHAAIILSMESVFAALGGWLILSEAMNAQGLFGCALMLTGMILPHIQTASRESRETG